MIKTLNKEKAIKILTEEEYEHMNAFNIIPNLSDKVLDYAEKNYGIIEIISQFLEEKRKQNTNLSLSFVCYSRSASKNEAIVCYP